MKRDVAVIEAIGIGFVFAAGVLAIALHPTRGAMIATAFVALVGGVLMGVGEGMR